LSDEECEVAVSFSPLNLQGRSYAMITEVKPRRASRRPALTDVRLAMPVPARSPNMRIHWWWLAAGLALAFAIPFVFADVLVAREVEEKWREKEG
jgi:hypothetical protein